MIVTKGLLYLVLGLFMSSSYGLKDPFHVIHDFKVIDFEYPSAEARQDDIDSGEFSYGLPAPIDTDVWYNKETGEATIFATVPRFMSGIPACLGVVVPNEHGESIIRPYPSWDWYKNSSDCNENRILSVFRIQIDECDRLWVLDVGATEVENVICNPQILAFDLHTNELVVKYELPSNQYNTSSTFVTPIVDVLHRRDNCVNTFVYAADCIGNALVVYDNANNDSWIIQDDTTMAYDANYEKYSIAGSNFTLTDGLLGMALTPHRINDSKRLYYHAMSSGSEHYFKTSDLQNKTLIESTTDFSDLIYTYNGSRWTQSAAEVIDSEGILYFGLHSNISLACFNTRGEYGIPGDDPDIVADNPETLQFISGIKAKTNIYGEEYIWLVSSRFQLIATGAINTNETNFRIQAARADVVRRESKCSRRRRFH